MQARHNLVNQPMNMLTNKGHKRSLGGMGNCAAPCLVMRSMGGLRRRSHEEPTRAVEGEVGRSPTW